MPPCRLATTSSSTPFLMPPLLACSTSADISSTYLLSLPRESSSKGDRFHSISLSPSHKRPERLCFFPSFLSSSLPFCGECHEKTAAASAASSAAQVARTATDRPACARIDRMSNRTERTVPSLAAPLHCRAGTTTSYKGITLLAVEKILRPTRVTISSKSTVPFWSPSI